VVRSVPDRAPARRWLAAATALLALAGPLQAQDEPWQELAVPEAPPLKADGLVSIDLTGSTLRFGVQPDSVSIGKDGVVRYVVVATSSTGAINAMYEGIHCASGQVKVYARHTPGTGWSPTKDAPWRALQDNSATRHSLAIARNGACIGRGANSSPQQVLRDLGAPPQERFRIEYR